MAQSDVRPTGDQDVTGSIPAGSGNILSHIDHEIFSTAIFSSTDHTRRANVSFLRKNMNKYWSVAKRTKLAQEKCG